MAGGSLLARGWAGAVDRTSPAAPGLPLGRPVTLASPFQGFWMGGFEGADHVNAHGQALDMAEQSGHWQRLHEDHRRAAQAGIRCIRESIGWRLCESPGGRIDLGRALRIQASAQRHGLQVLWTVMHYGLPTDLSLHDDALVDRLARFAAECVRVLGPGVYTPVNEISFLAWCASQPGFFAPPNALPAAEHETTQVSGYAVKRRLARAAIAAMHAMRDVAPGCRFMHVEPMVHVAAPHGRPELAARAAQVASWQWQAWDLLSGRTEPALGGRPELLDIVGVNHYHSSQWELETEARLDWAARDPRRRPFAALLDDAWQRYRRPLVVAETSHVGIGRAAWLHEICRETRAAQRAGVPVLGLTLYPLVDRPDWLAPSRWHKSGLWHVHGADGARLAEPEAKAALHDWQREWHQPARERVLLVLTHRRWDFVRHRTRQLLQPLARQHGWRIVVVEEPLPGADRPRLDRQTAGPHLDVLVPHLQGGGGFAALTRPPLAELLAGWLHAEGITAPLCWLTTPAAWPAARALAPSAILYDCDAAPPAADAALEADLMDSADLVLAAGRSLATPRAAAWRALRVLANGVDRAHFAPRPRPAAGWDHDEVQPHLPPHAACRVGCVGVVDERLDLGLVALLADARPEWQFVFIGPVVGLDPAQLPRRSNLVWAGAQPYRSLPWWMSGWRLALLPWVRSAALRDAQPLAVFEALAAGLPVVAPPLPELLPWRAAGVRCAAHAAAFLRACDEALAETPAEARARQRAAARRLRDWQAQAAVLAGWLDALRAQARPAYGARSAVMSGASSA